MRRKLFYGLLVIFLLSQTFQPLNVKAPEPLYIHGNFDMFFNTSQSLAIQSDDTLLIEVTNGILNGTSTTVNVYKRRGSLAFHSENNATFELSSPDYDGEFGLTVSGASSVVEGANFTWAITISTGQKIIIFWRWQIESWIDKYFMQGLGISGVILMVGSPTWIAFIIRRKGLDPDTFERTMYGLLLWCIGLCLLLMWLWS